MFYPVMIKFIDDSARLRFQDSLLGLAQSTRFLHCSRKRSRNDQSSSRIILVSGDSQEFSFSFMSRFLCLPARRVLFYHARQNEFPFSAVQNWLTEWMSSTNPMPNSWAITTPLGVNLPILRLESFLDHLGRQPLRMFPLQRVRRHPLIQTWKQHCQIR